MGKIIKLYKGIKAIGRQRKQGEIAPEIRNISQRQKKDIEKYFNYVNSSKKRLQAGGLPGYLQRQMEELSASLASGKKEISGTAKNRIILPSKSEGESEKISELMQERFSSLVTELGDIYDVITGANICRPGAQIKLIENAFLEVASMEGEDFRGGLDLFESIAKNRVLSKEAKRRAQFLHGCLKEKQNKH